MDTRLPASWRRTGEILRWRGAWILFLLGVRSLLRPLVYWHVYRIFITDIASQVPEPYAKENVETRIYSRATPAYQEDLEKIAEEVESLGEITRDEAAKRLERGDSLAVAYVQAEPAGYGWLSFTNGVVELAFGVTWRVHTGEAVRYGNFVHPKWRGRGIQSAINTAINRHALERGVSHTLASISTFNTQSLSLAKHYNRATAMKVTLIRIRPLRWTICRPSGASFDSRFQRTI